jgi:alpha-amylase
MAGSGRNSKWPLCSGRWRGFLAKYDEANLMHKRMLSVSEQLNEYIMEYPEDYQAIEKAKHHLFAGQCNCPYWHGIFGGLYLPHLRQAIYENLIKAKRWLSKISGGYRNVTD